MTGARLMIAGTGSGAGKTSVTIGLLEALRRRGLKVSACKCGPDYIDPLFHREVLGKASRNLDLFLCGEKAVRALLGESLAAAELTVIEGVMGFYDGVAGTDEASSYRLSEQTQTPVLLVVDGRGKALSLAAEIQGFARFLPNRIGAVILNRVNPASFPMLKALVEERCGLPVLGFLPSLPEAVLESRHLGLVTAVEVANLREKVELLACQTERTVALDAVVALARSAPVLQQDEIVIPKVAQVRIAVASDAAFCFTYQDNLRLLERMGAELVAFSPLQDTELPKQIHGLLLSGGYPELYAQQLSESGALRSIRAAVEHKMPVFAECGGFMALCRELVTADGRCYPMAGAVDAAVTMTNSLRQFGYVTLTARRDNLLCAQGETLRAHEFHYSRVTPSGEAFSARKASGLQWDGGYATGSLYAGYPHLHLWGNQDAARRFLLACRSWSASTQ